MSQLTDAERAVDGILKEVTATASKAAAASAAVPPGSPGRGGGTTPKGGAGAQYADVAGDAGFLADEVAEQLRSRLRELARQLADLQVWTGVDRGGTAPVGEPARLCVRLTIAATGVT